MLDLINDFLKLGIDSAGDTSSVWPLTLATVMMAAKILHRQSKD